MKKGTIDRETALFMATIAFLFFDVPQLLLTLTGLGMIVAPIISPVAAMVFGLWFSSHGVSMTSPKLVGRFLATIGGELVPGIDAAPIWTLTVAYTAYEHRPSKQEL